MFGLLSILLATVIGVILFAVVITPGSSGGKNGSVAGLPFVGSITTLPGSANEASGLGGVPSAAETAACQADGKVVEVALDAYQAVNGGFPTPPSPWSAATYQADYAPLTGSADHGPFLNTVPTTTHYVVEYDAAGHVWVEPPGQYDASYNPAHSVDAATSCSDVAH
jgi:hypothetical protein